MQHSFRPPSKLGFTDNSNFVYELEMKALRKPGYYWVVFLGDWDIASWSGEWWEFAGLPDAAYHDGDLERIGPYIPHPEEKIAPGAQLINPAVAPRLVRQG